MKAFCRSTTISAVRLGSRSACGWATPQRAMTRSVTRSGTSNQFIANSSRPAMTVADRGTAPPSCIRVHAERRQFGDETAALRVELLDRQTLEPIEELR